MTDETRKIESVKFAQESAKQLITLTTAIITFIFGAVSVGALSVTKWTAALLIPLLLALISSVVTGIVTLFSLSGILSSASIFAADNPLNSSHYSRFGRLQFYTFLAALIFLS